MTQASKQLGNQLKNRAATLLTAKKLQILAQNLRTKSGLVDIVAQDGDELVIVVLKDKTHLQFGAAIEMITPVQQHQLILQAHELQMKYQTDGVRIDIITVDNAPTEPVVKHHKRLIEFHG